MQEYNFIFDAIPVRFDLNSIAEKVRIRTGSEPSAQRLRVLAEEAAKVAHPKAAFKFCSLKVIDDERVDMGGVILTSSLLREKVEHLGRAFPYLATEGIELSKWSASFSLDDRPLIAALREAVVKQYEEMLETRITEQYGIRQVSAMKPGSLAFWPISEQEHLFRLLGPLPGKLGVTLLPNLMMDPVYSLAGIFFQTDKKFYNCQLCPEKDCPNRKVPSTVL